MAKELLLMMVHSYFYLDVNSHHQTWCSIPDASCSEEAENARRFWRTGSPHYLQPNYFNLIFSSASGDTYSAAMSAASTALLQTITTDNAGNSATNDGRFCGHAEEMEDIRAISASKLLSPLPTLLLLLLRQAVLLLLL
jgi:hypothetical protein